MANQQNWTPLILYKSRTANGNDPKKIVVNNPVGTKEYKNLVSDDPSAPKKVDLSVSQLIIQYRKEHSLSQKDLALKLNMRVNTIRDYENGSAVHNNKEISKIKNFIKN